MSPICEHGRARLMCGDCMDNSKGTKGTIKLDHATVHVELRFRDGWWTAVAVLEMHCKEFGSSEPIRHRASTPKEAWAAMSTDLYKKLTQFN